MVYFKKKLLFKHLLYFFCKLAYFLSLPNNSDKYFLFSLIRTFCITYMLLLLINTCFSLALISIKNRGIFFLNTYFMHTHTHTHTLIIYSTSTTKFFLLFQFLFNKKIIIINLLWMLKARFNDLFLLFRDFLNKLKINWKNKNG